MEFGIWITRKHRLGFHPIYVNEVNKKITAEQEQVQVLFTTQG